MVQGGVDRTRKTIEADPLDLMDFERTGLLGRGHSGVVFKAHWRGKTAVLRISDIAQEPDLEQELLAETAN